jgi:hypothetical protein
MPPHPASFPVLEAAPFAPIAPALRAGALGVAPVSLPADPASSRPSALPAQSPDAGVVEAEPARSPAPAAAPSKPSPRHGAGVALRTLVAQLAASPFLSLFGRRRRVTPTLSRRIEPALATGAEPPRAAGPVPSVAQQAGTRRADATGTETVPVLARLPLTGPAGLPGIVAAFAREPDGALAQAAADVHATLRAAFVDAAPDTPMTVLVTPLRDRSNCDAESVALSLALAAAGAGRRVLLVGARSDDHLRRTLVPNEVPLCLLEREGSLRPLYRLAAAGRTVALLPDDPEAVGVFRSSSSPEAGGVQRRRGSSGFDTVVVVGTGVEADAGSSDCGAHIVLIAAPQGTAAADFRAASRRLRRAGDRPCGALLVPAAPAVAAIPAVAAMPSRPVTAAPPEMPAAVGEPSWLARRVAPVPTGQRRSFDATRRRRSV